MQAEAVAMQAGNSGRGDRPRRRPRHIADLDSRRLDLDRRGVEYRRYNAIFVALIADLGGADVATTAQSQIADRAAFIAMTLETMQIAALAGEQIDLQRYGELTDRLRRLLDSIGLERRARDVTPTLQQYIASKRALPVDSVSASSATETAAEPEKRASDAASPSEGPPS